MADLTPPTTIDTQPEPGASPLPPARPASPPTRGLPVSTIAAVMLPLILLAFMGWERRWMADDGFIHLRVVQQFLHGNGLVFNAGERVEASTSPLWVLFLAGSKWLLGFASLEWIAVVLGLVLSVGGLAMAELGALKLLGPRSGQDLVVPAGALVVAVLPPFWDFTTSGLETGLVFAWLGACFWLLAVLATNSRYRNASAPLTPLRLGCAVLVGLGPVIRPDLTVFTAPFLAALLVIAWRHGWRCRLTVVVFTAAVPVCFELFRMAYYAALVPNTALVKEAARPEWSRGWNYLENLAAPYWLWIPGLFILASLGRLCYRRWRQQEWEMLAVIASATVGGFLYGLYVVRLGGDFMHARLLLPALFSLMMPGAVIAVTSVRSATAIAAASIASWALVCGVGLRVSNLDQVVERGNRVLHTHFDIHGIADERAQVVATTHRRNPITIADWQDTGQVQNGRFLKRLAHTDRRLLIIQPTLFAPAYRYPLRKDFPIPIVATEGSVGIFSYTAGPDVFVADTAGLADPVGSRLRVQGNGRPGHEKSVDIAWFIARFADPNVPVVPATSSRQVAAARRALSCAALQRLLHDIDRPLSLRRMGRNVLDSVDNTRLRVSGNVIRAEQELCGR